MAEIGGAQASHEPMLLRILYPLRGTSVQGLSSPLEEAAEGKSRPRPWKRGQANGGPPSPAPPSGLLRGSGSRPPTHPGCGEAAVQPPAAPNSGRGPEAGGSPGGWSRDAAQAPPRPRSEGIALPVGGSPPALPLPTRRPG